MQSLKSYFPIFGAQKGLIYLDHAATAQKPMSVIEAVTSFYMESNANIHRSTCRLSDHAEALYVASKKYIADYLHVDSEEIVFTSGTTASLNIIAQTLIDNHQLSRGDVLILGVSEHHANIVPWMIASKKADFEIRYLTLREDFTYDIDALAALLDGRVKVVALQHASNVTGAIHDLARVRGIIQDRIFVVDAAQTVATGLFDLVSFDADFAAFSAHKCYGPQGVGVLYGKKDLLRSFTPPMGGGGAINFVKRSGFAFAGLPTRWEPGTPNVAGVCGMMEGVRFAHEICARPCHQQAFGEMVAYTYGRFTQMQEIKLFAAPPLVNLGIFSFALPSHHAGDVAEALARENICTRAGHHCCEILHTSWGVPATLRISLGGYSEKVDIDRFFEVLQGILSSK